MTSSATETIKIGPIPATPLDRQILKDPSIPLDDGNTTSPKKSAFIRVYLWFLLEKKLTPKIAPFRAVL